MTVEKDTALILKMKFDNKEISNYRQAKKYLDESVLFKKLLYGFEHKVLNLHWRLNELSEIPFSGNNETVKKWLDELIKISYTGEGFSLTGKNDYILSCYNAMITTLLIKLGSKQHEKIMTGIDWILKYQNMERDLECKWEGGAIKKYGGCMKKIPCYIGLVKSVIALSEYKESALYKKNILLEEKLEKGLEYILKQEVYKRRSDGKPVTNYIDKISYPFTFKTNIIEILRLIKDNNKINDPRCKDAKELLLKKQKKEGYWYQNKQYVSGCWIPFDKINEPAQWASYIVESILK